MHPSHGYNLTLSHSSEGTPLSVHTTVLGPPPTVGAASQRVLPPHLGITRGAPREEVVGGLAAEAGLAPLLAAAPLVSHHRSRVVVHEHIMVEVAG